MSDYSTAGGKLYRDDVCLANFVPKVQGVYRSSPDLQPALVEIAYTVCGHDAPRTSVVLGRNLRTLDFEALDLACRYEITPSKGRRWVNNYLCGQVANFIVRGDCGVFLNTSGWHDLPSPAFAAGGKVVGMTPGSAVRLSEGLSSTHLACDDAVDVNTSVTGLVTAFQRTPEAMVAFSFALFTAIRSLLQREFCISRGHRASARVSWPSAIACFLMTTCENCLPTASMPALPLPVFGTRWHNSATWWCCWTTFVTPASPVRKPIAASCCRGLSALRQILPRLEKNWQPQYRDHLHCRPGGHR